MPTTDMPATDLHPDLPVAGPTGPAHSPSPARDGGQRYLRVGGVLVLAAAASACSFGPATPTQAGEEAPATTAPPPSDGDQRSIESAAKLESTVVALYEQWAAAKFITGNTQVTDVIGALSTGHTAHLGAMNSLLVRNGGKEIKAAIDPALKARLAPTDPTNPTQLLQAAASVEETLAQTYLSWVGTFGDAKLDLDFVAMAGADARHAVAARGTENPNADPVTAARYPVTKALKV